MNLNAKSLKTRFIRTFSSTKALAIPVTFLVLFVSMLGVIAVTYYYSIERVTANSQDLKVSMAKQGMSNLNDNILSVFGQSGSSRTIDFNDYDGELNVQASANLMTISITDNNTIASTVFNATIGQIAYELPYAESPETGLFLKGDSRPIVNQSGATIAQLYIRRGTERQEILLRYRPFTSFINSGTQGDKSVVDLRMYVVNLNASQDIELCGQIPLKISCVSIENSVSSYDIPYQLNTLTVTAVSDGTEGQVAIPISCATGGAVLTVEVVICDIEIERWVR